MYLSAEQIQYLDAAARGEVEVVRRLLASGMNPDTLDPRRLPRDRTALMHAAANGNLDVVELLLTAGAKVDAKDKGLGVALPGGNTALLLALKSKQVRVAQRLLDAGADPAVKCGGISAFGLAASLGDVSLLRKMLKKGLSPDLTAGRTVDTPLVSALFARRTEVVRVLLSAGADPGLKFRGRISPLELAIQGGLVEAVQLLLHHGADPNAVSAGGATPLMNAVQCGQKQVVKILLTRGAAVNARSESGKTALDIAQDQLKRKPAAASSPETARQAADPVISAETGPEIVRLLLDAGARTGDQLPADPPVRSQKRATKSKRPHAAPSNPGAAKSGVKDFLEFIYYTEPEFSVIAVKAALGRTASAFAELRKPRLWLRDVPRRGAAGFRRANASLVAAVSVRGNPWTVIIRSIFRLGADDCALAVADAKDLSARLKTKAIAFVGEGKADAIGYDFFERGRLAEHAQWIEHKSICWFHSRFRRKPKKEDLAEDFTDRVFRQQGIYLPACYPRSHGNRAWLCAEKSSAGVIRCAEVLVLARRGKRRSP